MCLFIQESESCMYKLKDLSSIKRSVKGMKALQQQSGCVTAVLQLRERQQIVTHAVSWEVLHLKV